MTPSEFALVRSVFGKPAWQIKWDHQVGLRLDFGAPYLHVREPREVDTPKKRVRALFKRLVTLRGSHYLWIAPEAWRLVLSDGRVVRRFSSARASDRACAQLRGEALIGLSIDTASGTTTFRFDLGGRIDAIPPRGWGHEPDDELWSLWVPRNRFVAVYAGGYFGVGRTTGPDPTPRPFQAKGVVGIGRFARRRTRGAA